MNIEEDFFVKFQYFYFFVCVKQLFIRGVFVLFLHHAFMFRTSEQFKAK